MANHGMDRTPTRASLHQDRSISSMLSSPKMAPTRIDRTAATRRPQAAAAVEIPGEVVSDDNDGTDGDDEQEAMEAEDHDMDEDEDDVFALSAAASHPSRLAGRKVPQLLRKSSSGATTAGTAGPSGGDAATPFSEASHDDNYDAVDAMSDGGDLSDFDPVAEEALLKESERDLIKEFKKIEKRTDLHPRRDVSDPWAMIKSPDFTAVEPNIDFGKDPFLGLSAFDPTRQAMWDEAEGDLAAWRLPAPLPPTTTVASSTQELAHDEPMQALDSSIISSSTTNTTTPNPTQKRVRFRRPSSVTSDEDPAEAFPDLMDSLATPGRPFYPPIHHVFSDHHSANGHAAPEYDSSDDSADEYIVATTFANTLQTTAQSFVGGAESESEEASSDTDSDGGDTTDEEAVEEDDEERAACIRAARAKLSSKISAAAAAAASSSSTTPSTPEVAKKPTSKQQRAPLSRQTSDSAGTTDGQQQQAPPKTKVFQHDPTRAILSLGADGVKLQSPRHPPETDRAFWDRARRAMGPAACSPSGKQVSWQRSESRAARQPPKPFTCNQTLGNIFDGNLPVPEPVGVPVASSPTSRGGGGFQMPDDTAMLVDRWSDDGGEESGSDDDEFGAEDDDANEAGAAFNMNELVDFELCTTTFADETDDDHHHGGASSRPVSAGVFSPSSSSHHHASSFGGGADMDVFSSPGGAGWAADDGASSSVFDADILDDNTTATTTSTLSHLSQQPSLVASFRNNQYRARAVGALAINPIQRAETSERNAIQTARQGAGNLPFSPARRRHISQDLTGAGVSKSGGSPRALRHRGRGSSFAQRIPAAVAAELQRTAAGRGEKGPASTAGVVGLSG